MRLIPCRPYPHKLSKPFHSAKPRARNWYLQIHEAFLFDQWRRRVGMRAPNIVNCVNWWTWWKWQRHDCWHRWILQGSVERHARYNLVRAVFWLQRRLWCIWHANTVRDSLCSHFFASHTFQAGDIFRQLGPHQGQAVQNHSCERWGRQHDNSIIPYKTRQCSTIQKSTIRTIQYHTIQNKTIQNKTIEYNTHTTLQHGILQYHTIQGNTNQYGTRAHNTIHDKHYATIQCKTIQDNTIRYNTI